MFGTVGLGKWELREMVRSPRQIQSFRGRSLWTPDEESLSRDPSLRLNRAAQDDERRPDCARQILRAIPQGDALLRNKTRKCFAANAGLLAARSHAEELGLWTRDEASAVAGRDRFFGPSPTMEAL